MKKSYTLSELEHHALNIRISIVKMLEEAGSGHSAGPLGLADIFTALYFVVMKHNPAKPNHPDRDRFLISNGHCAPVLYATMAECGYFSKAELSTLRKFGSRLQGHPERDMLPGIETTSGPLGEGLSQACGIALGNILNKNFRSKTFVTLGDGELNEGNVWEAAMLAAKYKLHRITAIIDRNNIQIDGTTEDVMPLENLRAKWEAFGWDVLEVNGNDLEAVVNTLKSTEANTIRPQVIIAHTIPGYGVDFMEYDFKWHGKPPNHEEAKLALKELYTLGGKLSNDHQF